MRRVFSSTAQAEAFFSEIGFVKEDDKWYFSADTSRASYLTFDVVASTGFFKYTASSGTEFSLASFTGSTSPFLIVEYFELVNGGVAFRLAMGIDSTATINTPLQFAVVAKEDESGFVYFFASSRLKYDDLSGTLKEPSQWSALNLGDTNSIAIVTKAYDNVANFIDAHVRVVLAAQNVNSTILFTFDCGGKKYLSGMFASTTTVKCGQLCFEVE